MFVFRLVKAGSYCCSCSSFPAAEFRVRACFAKCLSLIFFKTTDKQMMEKIKEKESEERENGSMNIRNVIWKHQIHIVL